MHHMHYKDLCETLGGLASTATAIAPVSVELGRDATYCNILNLAILSAADYYEIKEDKPEVDGN